MDKVIHARFYRGEIDNYCAVCKIMYFFLTLSLVCLQHLKTISTILTWIDREERLRFRHRVVALYSSLLRSAHPCVQCFVSHSM